MGGEWKIAVVSLAACLSAGVTACVRGAPGVPATLHQAQVFTDYSPLSRNDEILRRIMTPLGFARGQRLLARRGQTLDELPIALAEERFSVYVPAGSPPKEGYGLLVFVAPWPQPTEPRRWRRPLDRHGMILVNATNSGNESRVYERRVPLALLAYENARRRYPVDPRRVYVWGWSGGSRVAEVLALAYPDVFRGALLNAGSEPIGGERGIHLPPADLFERFQETRLVYVTGGLDEQNLDDDRASRASMSEWCVFDIEVITPGNFGHAPLDPPKLDRALGLLEERSPPDPGKLADCNARVQQTLSAKLAAVEAAIARGDPQGARAQLDAIDTYYGGLAARPVLELDAKLSARP